MDAIDDRSMTVPRTQWPNLGSRTTGAAAPVHDTTRRAFAGFRLLPPGPVSPPRLAAGPRQRMTGLRTNGLVAVGSAMLIIMGGLIAGDGGQRRVAAYVVSGIGFIGGGVILKNGFNIRGLNTAATLWCTVAVGTLAGLGQLGFAALGDFGVLCTNRILRPLAHLNNRTPTQKETTTSIHRLRCTCRTTDEINIRTMLIQNVGRTPLTVIALHSLDDEVLASPARKGLFENHRSQRGSTGTDRHQAFARSRRQCDLMGGRGRGRL